MFMVDVLSLLHGSLGENQYLTDAAALGATQCFAWNEGTPFAILGGGGICFLGGYDILSSHHRPRYLFLFP